MNSGLPALSLVIATSLTLLPQHPLPGSSQPGRHRVLRLQTSASGREPQRRADAQGPGRRAAPAAGCSPPVALILQQAPERLEVPHVGCVMEPRVLTALQGVVAKLLPQPLLQIRTCTEERAPVSSGKPRHHPPKGAPTQRPPPLKNQSFPCSRNFQGTGKHRTSPLMKAAHS